MGIATWAMKQTIVYWAPSGTNAQGDRTYASAVEILGRWDDVSKLFIDGTGTQQVSNARVLVNTAVLKDGVLFLGSLTDLSDTTDPLANAGAYPIRKVENIPAFTFSSGVSQDNVITAVL